VQSGEFFASPASATVTISASSAPVIPPTIETSGTQGAQDDSRPFSFGWAVSNVPAGQSVRVKVTLDDRTIFVSTDASGVVSPGGQGVGLFRLTVELLDAQGQVVGSAERTATISDDDTTGPQIDLSVTTDRGGRFFSFRWATRDESGLSGVEALLVFEGVVVMRSSEIAGEFVVDALVDPGDYVLMVRSIDGDSDRPDDTSTSDRMLGQVVELRTKLSLAGAGAGSGGPINEGALAVVDRNLSDPSDDASAARSVPTPPPLVIMNASSSREAEAQLPRDTRPQNLQSAAQSASASQIASASSVASPRDRAFGLLPLPGNTGVQGVSPLLDGDDSVGLIEYLRQINQSPGEATSIPERTSLVPVAPPEKPVAPVPEKMSMLPTDDAHDTDDLTDPDRPSPRATWLAMMLPIGLVGGVSYRHIRSARADDDDETEIDDELSGIRLRR